MIDLINLSVEFGLQNLFSNVNIKINPADKTCIVGSNGSGKSTLMKIIIGMQHPSSGTVQKKGGLKIGYLPQDAIQFKGNSLFSQVKSSMREIIEIDKKEDELNNALADKNISSEKHDQLLIELGSLNDQKDQIEYFSADSKIEKVLMGLGFAEKDFFMPVESFSGGWQMRIQLASILLASNDALLLDEPTNHLDIDSLEWIIDYLNSFKGAKLIISHDKHFLKSVTDKTIEIFNRNVTYFKGNYDAYLNFKIERDARLVSEYDYQQKKIKDTQRFIERFRYKNTKAKQVQSRIKQLEKLERVELPDNEKEIRIRFPEPPKSGIIPIKLENVCKSYEANSVFENLDFQIERGDKIAFVGPNGAGKTTLAKIIADRLKVSSGNVIKAQGTFISYFAQETTEGMNLDNTIIDELAGATENKTMVQLRTLLGSFLFSDDDIFKKVAVLSGGEKSRLALAKILVTKSNLLVLDEPTNHLDISSKEIFRQALINFPGSIVLISHDIDFLRPIVNKVLEIRKSGNKLFEGDIDYYLFKRKEIADNKHENSTAADESSKATRKDQKRMEASLRQKKYNATKDISAEIELLEIKIEEAEKSKKRIETELTQADLYKNPVKLKELNLDYESAKKEINILLNRWTELSDKLEFIETSFNP